MQNIDEISVIVPVYNVEKYLRECVDSIMAQTYTNIEVILVDDGSPDNSGPICDEYAATNANVHVVHKANGGLSSARNAGLDMASGKYVMFIDSDDKILPEMAETMMSTMHGDTDLVSTQLMPWQGRSKNKFKIDKDIKFTGKEALQNLLKRKIDQSCCTKLFKRELIGSTRFIKGRTNEDFIFLFSYLQRCRYVHNLPDGFYLYRHNPQSITSTFGIHYFDIMKNAQEVANSAALADMGLKADGKTYLDKVMLNSCYHIIRCRRQKDYKAQLKECQRYIRRNFFSILFNTDINYKERMKLVLILYPA